MSTQSKPRTSQEIAEELKITLEARRELGAEFDELLVQSFMEKIDVAIDDRVEAKAGELLKKQKRFGNSSLIRLGLTMGLAIPLVAIAGGVGGWIGIVAVAGTILLLNLPWGNR